jgi:glycosyltransferase involved in cell wall biosynthesis
MLKMKNRLIVINYVMDPSHPALAHQFDTVVKLARNFEEITVLTSKYNGDLVPENVSVLVVNWRQGHKFYNIIALNRKFLQIRGLTKYSHVFFHMTPNHSLALLPILKMLRKKNVLWYAHAHQPVGLAFLVRHVDSIVTSTSGSFPISSNKVNYIGQGIDLEIFNSDPEKFRFNQSKKKFVYAGRMDKSKGVQEIIDLLKEIRETYDIELTLIGNNSEHFKLSEGLDWIHAMPSVPRKDLPSELVKHGVFIHNFIGSLDKVLIENVMLRMPIITSNLEFANTFELFSKPPRMNLHDQIIGYLESDSASINTILEKNYQNALQNHNLLAWINKLTAVINQA